MTVLSGTNFVTITEAARLLGRSRRLVGHLIELHGIATHSVGTGKLIGPKSLNALRRLAEKRRDVRTRAAG